MVMAGCASRAVTAMVQWAHDDLLTRRDVRNPLAHRLDRTGHLVPDNPVEADARVHVPVEHMHVGAADPAIGDPDRGLAGSGSPGCCLSHREGLVAPVIGGGDRVVSHLCAPSCAALSLSQSKATPIPGSLGATAK